MTEEPREAEASEDRLRRQIEAYHDAALVFAAVRAGIPDLLAAEPLAAKTLAPLLGFSAPHLKRVLDGLAVIGVCEALPDGRYALTDTGRALAIGSESSLREKVLVVLGQYWLPWLELLRAVETGAPAFATVHGMGVRQWRQENPDQGKDFHRYAAKEELAGGSALLGALDIGAARTIAAIGGGYGAMLIPILQAHPQIEAIVFDEPEVVAAAPPLFDTYRVADRARFIAGDLLTEIPVEADLYVLKGVLQQHDDAGARQILETVRRAMPDGARLAVIERLMPERPADDPEAVMLDLHLMTIYGGRVRALAEIEALLSQASLTLSNVTTTGAGLSVIEALPH